MVSLDHHNVMSTCKRRRYKVSDNVRFTTVQTYCLRGRRFICKQTNQTQTRVAKSVVMTIDVPGGICWSYVGISVT